MSTTDKQKRTASQLRKDYSDLSVSVVERIAENAGGDIARARAIVEGFRAPVPPATAAAHEHRAGVAAMSEDQKLAFVRGVLAPCTPPESVLRDALARSNFNVNAALDYLLGPMGPCAQSVAVGTSGTPKRKKSDAAAARKAELSRQREDIEKNERLAAQRAQERAAALESHVAELQRQLKAAEAQRTADEERLRQVEAETAERQRLQEKLHTLEIQLEDAISLQQKQQQQSAATPASSSAPADGGCVVTARAVTAPDGSVGVAYQWDLRGVRPTPRDWVGLYYCNRQYPNKHSAWQSLDGNAQGEGVFPKLRLGYWDVRLYLAGTNVEQTRSLPVLLGPRVLVNATFDAEDRRFEVTWSEDIPPEQPSTLTAKDWIGMYRAGTFSNKQFLCYQACREQPLHFAAPRTPGAYEFRYFRAASGHAFSGKSMPVAVPNNDALTVLPTSSPTRVRVRWACFSREPSSSDWVGLHAAGEQDSTKYLVSVYCSKGVYDSSDHDSGVVELPLAGIKDGEYEVRFFSYSAGKYTPLLRTPLQVPPPLVTVDQEPEAVAAAASTSQ